MLGVNAALKAVAEATASRVGAREEIEEDLGMSYSQETATTQVVPTRKSKLWGQYLCLQGGIDLIPDRLIHANGRSAKKVRIEGNIPKVPSMSETPFKVTATV